MIHMLNRGGLSMPSEMLCGVVDQTKKLPWSVDRTQVTCLDCLRIFQENARRRQRVGDE